MIMAIDKVRVAIYVRVSTDMQADKDSLPMQRKDLSSYCEVVLNTSDYVIFEDAGYSGKNMVRPAFQQMMTAVRKGEFSHILVWKIDRISRNLLDFAQMYAELKKLGVTFVSKNEQFDTSSAMGEAMLKIILIFAELERNMTSERVTATMISRAKNGQWNGGRVPFGYDYSPADRLFSLNQEESGLVHYMFDSYQSCHSLTSLARDLNDHGYRTRNGNLWTATSISLILNNPFYSGDYLYNVNRDSRSKLKDKSEWVLIRNHHPAIVSREQQIAVTDHLTYNIRLKERKLRSGYETSRTHVFGGLLYCSTCGKMMYSTPASDRDGWKHSNYLCPTRRQSKLICSQPTVSDTKIGEFLLNLVLNIFHLQKLDIASMTRAEIQSAILKGSTFKKIDRIDESGLSALIEAISYGHDSDLYGKHTNLFTQKKPSQIDRLERRREKLLRAFDRLSDVYLYGDDALTLADYVEQKKRIQSELDDIDKQLTSDSNDQVDDPNFIAKASEFIIARSLQDRNYIYYKRLASEVDQSVLRSFFLSILTCVDVYGDSILGVTFRNGISLRFESLL